MIGIFVCDETTGKPEILRLGVITKQNAAKKHAQVLPSPPRGYNPDGIPAPI